MDREFHEQEVAVPIAEKQLKPENSLDDLYVEVTSKNLSMYDDGHDAVELRKKIREGGSELTDRILDEINTVVKDGQMNGERHYRAFELTTIMEYSATPVNADRIGQLLNNEYVVRDTDRSMIHRLLSILQRIGTESSLEQLKSFIVARGWTDNQGRLVSHYRDDARLAITTALHINKRLRLDEKVVSAAIANINDQLHVSDQSIFDETAVDSLRQEVEDDKLERTFEMNFRELPHSEEMYSDWDQYDEVYPGSPFEIRGGYETDSDHRMDEIIKRVNKLTLKEDVFPTALEAIQIHMFNYIDRRPNLTTEQIETEYEKIKKLSRREAECSHPRNPLPTIGIELEIPEYSLDKSKIKILNAFGINNYPEMDNLHEVNPQYSYSPSVQARIIQELYHMDALPTYAGSLDGSQHLSLHVNFGMPEGVTDKMLTKYETEVQRLNDLLIYGFTSSGRLLSRKTFSSYHFKEADSSNKNETMMLDADEENSRRGDLVRLELRANEFKDYRNFRMLTESQRLVAMLAAHIKDLEQLPMTLPEIRLAQLWREFEIEVVAFFLEGVAPKLNLADDNPREAAKLVKEGHVTDMCRHYISEYSRKVAFIIEADERTF
jgi:hypothetical protein